MSDIEVEIERHHCGNRITRKRAQARIERFEIRRELADAQLALAQAIQDSDPETIAEARRVLAEALERLRALT